MFPAHFGIMKNILIFCLLLCAGSAQADLSGPARVIDGDTLLVGQTRIRMHGIDAPESTQHCTSAQGVVFACGAAATRALTRMIGGAAVRCVARDIDRYGRTVAQCNVAGRDLGHDMVAAGYAVAFRRYSMDYAKVEDAARRGKTGLWAAQMQDPAAYRAQAAAAPAAPATCAIKGNISGSGRIYHMAGQEHYAATRISTARGERWFCTEDDARAAGWRAARR